MNKFVFLTDTHYWTDAPKDYGAPKMLTKGREIHDAIPPAVNALDPDFVVHGGDFLCGGSSFDLPTDIFEQSIRDVRKTFDRLSSPFYPIPGNHDCDAQTWKFDAFNAAFDVPDLLSVDEVLIELAWVVECLIHRTFGYFMKNYASHLLFVNFGSFYQVPRNCFPFPVRVGCKIDIFGGLRSLRNLRDHLLLVRHHPVGRFEGFIGYVDSKCLIWDITDVPHRS